MNERAIPHTKDIISHVSGGAPKAKPEYGSVKIWFLVMDEGDSLTMPFWSAADAASGTTG